MIRFTKAKMLQKAKPRARGRKKAALDKLYSYLNAAEPEAIEFLVSFWNTQAQGVTYAELREAYLAGGITDRLYQRWTEDYSVFIQNKLAPLWQQAANAAAAEVSAQYPKFVYEPSVSAAMGYIKDHGAELVTNITNEQRNALNAVVAHISGHTAVTPDEAARIIRPTVGLTVRQSLANLRHRQAVEEAYLKAHPNCNPETAKKRAAESAARYAGRQHRYRAQNIARTELAFAYNAGHYGATQDAQAQGYIGDCLKFMLTADDERVCPICGRIDGEKRNMNDPFSFGKLFPPVHPSCRCAVGYEEIPGTNLSSTVSTTLNGESQQNEVIPDNMPGLIGGATSSGLTVMNASGIITDMKVQDVTNEYQKNASPGKGLITYDEGYKQGKHQEEIKIANWLHDTYGGDIRLLTEADALGVKMPDFEWRGKLWELKSTTTEKSADSAVRQALKQIQENPGGIVLDYGMNEIVLMKLQKILDSRMKRNGARIVDVMILSRNKTVKIFRYKK